MFKKENIRKNFFRVKQIADQNLGRVEKTEVLSDDLQSSEKKVELVKHVTSNSVKKLGASLLGSGSGDAEKRLKKMPEASLAHSLIESATMLGECVMGQMYQICGDCENTLAQHHLQYELEVDKQVIEPLQDIIDVEIPQITKLKKALNKVTLDMDSAKSRHNNALKQAQVPGVNMQSAASKVDTVKEELEEAMNRVDLAKDAYTTGLFNFLAKEAEHSQNLLNLLEAQASYHQQALEVIQKVIPKMQEVLSCNPAKPVYGIPLEEHLRVTNRDIAAVLEACVCFLLETGLEEEGLFRIAGMASKVKKLKASFDAGVEFEDSGELDPHTVAGALKQYLRELPEPLLTFKLFPDFMAAAQQPQDQRLQALWVVVDRLPKPNYDNFRYLIKFLSKLTEKAEVNKMTPGNIAIVIGPNLIWSEGDNGPNMMNTGILSLITELIVQHADWFFPGAQDFQATQRNQASNHSRRKSNPFIQKPDISPKPAVTMATPKSPVSPSAETPAEVVTSATPNPPASQSAGALAQGNQSGIEKPGNQSGNEKNAQSKKVSQVRMTVLQITGPGTSNSAAQPGGTGEVTKPTIADRSSQKSSQDSVSSSSESTSLSDTSSNMKEYENADTLERKDSADHFLTARGDLSLFSNSGSPASSPAVASRRSNPVITFDPNERHKHGKSTKRRAPKPRSETLPGRAHQGSVESPVSRNVHSEMYSTAFALQSLGDGGTWPKYLNTVRSMWDEKLHKTGNGNSDLSIVGGSADSSIVGNDSGKGQARSNEDVQFGCGDESPQPNRAQYDQQAYTQHSQNQHQVLDRVGSDQSSTPQASPAPNQMTASQQALAQTPPTSSRSPSVSPAVSNSNLQGAPLAESEDFNPAIRRPARKPAPPPPERPYSVAVSASVKPGQQAAQFQTWPRQAVLSQSDEGDINLQSLSDKQKTLPPERPHPPERVSSLPQGSLTSHGDRPKVPPPVVPPGHQRSASTGAPVTIPGGHLRTVENEQLAGSLQTHAGLVPDKAPHHGSNNQLQQQQQQQDKLTSSSLNRHTIARPPRPMPPPPPPPENSIVEQTHL